MDLKDILCQPMEEEQQSAIELWKIQSQRPYCFSNDDHPHQNSYYAVRQDKDHWRYARSTSMGNLSNRSNSMGVSGVHPYFASTRKRVHSEQQYRTSPIASWGHQNQHHPRHTLSQHCPDDVLIDPFTSISVSMDTTQSSPILSVSPSFSSTISPSSSSSSLSSSSSSTLSPISSLPSPVTPTTPAHHYCRLAPSSSHNQYQPPPPPRQRKISTGHEYSSSVNNQIQTRTPWTPAEDLLLQKGYEQGLSWAMISATHLPHRSRGCCWGRFKTLQSKNLIHVKVQQPPSRLARRAWKAMGFNKKPSGWNSPSSPPLSPTSA